MSEYSRLLALKVQKTQRYAENVRLASMMHDIVKFGIPDAILLKPDVLTDQEKKQMQKHTIFGACF
jgi:putative two-component system response regulator